MLGSGWEPEKGIERMCGQAEKQQQQQLRGRKRNGEREAIHVTEALLVLLMTDPEVLETHIVHSGLEGKRLEINPTGRESEPSAQLPV